MKTCSYLSRHVVMMLLAVLCVLLPSCSKDKEEDEPKQSLDVYPWVDHPKSYIRMFDTRMEFRMLDVQRNGTSLQVEYTLTNTGFGQDVSITFGLSEAAAHDNLGNTYKCTSGGGSEVLAYIDGARYSIFGWWHNATFLPHQTIRGSFTIKNFNVNATAFSISVHVKLTQPSGIILGGDSMDFVNIPVEP